MEKNNWMPALAVGLLIILAVFVQRPTQVMVSDQPNINQVQVSGHAELKVAADLGILSFAVESKAANAKAAQDMNRQTANRVQDALKAAGLTADEMQTSGYSLYEDKRYNHQTGNYESYGYVASHTLQVRTEKLEDLGKFMDIAVKSGANRVDNIYFELSDEAKVEARDAALQAAAKMARQKADTLASSMSISLGKTLSLSESDYGVTPYYAREMMAVAESDAYGKGAPTQIEPGDVTVSATVTASFEIV